MRTIILYMIGQFWRFFALFLGVFVFIYLLVDFLDRIDNFIEYKSAPWEILLYFANKLPWVILQVTAVSVMLSVIVVFSLMNHNNELVALKAGGVSVFRLSLPFLFIALLVSLITFALTEGVVPYTNARFTQLWEYEMRHQEQQHGDMIPNFKGWLRSEGVIYQVRGYNRRWNLLMGVTLFFFDQDFRLTRRVDAELAQKAHGLWFFDKGTDKTIAPQGLFKVEKFKQISIFLPEELGDFYAPQKAADEMSLSELDAHIGQLQREGYDTRPLEVDRQIKFSLPFVCTVLTFLVIPLTLRQSRHASMAVSVGLGAAAAFAYLLFFGLTRSLGHSGALPMIMAAWLPNLVFVLTGAYLMVTLRQ